ncbi:MAG: replicative DNA helicase [Gammaproteobacteria bacterium]
MTTPAVSEFSKDGARSSLRVPPHSIPAEQSVLGGLLIDNRTWDSIAELLHEEDFYRRDHRLIFRAIGRLISDAKPCDIITLSEWLDNSGILNEAGGHDYLAALAENIPSAANVRSYAGIVRECSILRQLIEAGNDIVSTALQPEGQNSEQLLDYAERRVFEIAEQENRGRKNYRQINDLLSAALDKVDELYRSDSPITGVATGFDDFDDRTAGLQKSDLIIVAGRPSMGKTSFAINIAEHVAIKGKKSVAIFSMEMPGEQLAMRMLGSLSRIDQQKIRTGRIAEDDWPRLTSTLQMMQDAKMFIDDTPALSPSEIRSRARRIAREHELDLIIVDYLQLMQVAGTAENRTTEISEISRGLKALAKELNVPVIALSQLNRGVESRTDKRPVMSDLRESGAIEQDADLIVFIYRDEVYDKESVHKGKAEIIIAKQRNGPIGECFLAFRGQYTRFENFVDDSRYGGGGFA